MPNALYTFDTFEPEAFTDTLQQRALAALENAQVLFFPTLAFNLSLFSEDRLWSDNILDKTHKNVSYHYLTQQLGKLKKPQPDQEVIQLLRSLMHHYAEFAKNLVATVLPSYNDSLIWG